jgi:hypothetical protein
MVHPIAVKVFQAMVRVTVPKTRSLDSVHFNGMLPLPFLHFESGCVMTNPVAVYKHHHGVVTSSIGVKYSANRILPKTIDEYYAADVDGDRESSMLTAMLEGVAASFMFPGSVDSCCQRILIPSKSEVKQISIATLVVNADKFAEHNNDIQPFNLTYGHILINGAGCANSVFYSDAVILIASGSVFLSAVGHSLLTARSVSLFLFTADLDRFTEVAFATSKTEHTIETLGISLFSKTVMDHIPQQYWHHLKLRRMDYGIVGVPLSVSVAANKLTITYHRFDKVVIPNPGVNCAGGEGQCQINLNTVTLTLNAPGVLTLSKKKSQFNVPSSHKYLWPSAHGGYESVLDHNTCIDRWKRTLSLTLGQARERHTFDNTTTRGVHLLSDFAFDAP